MSHTWAQTCSKILAVEGCAKESKRVSSAASAAWAAARASDAFANALAVGGETHIAQEERKHAVYLR